VPVQQLVQYGRECANKSSVQAVHLSLEDCMEERQHHLNESSSARLRISQKMEILPSPNSKSLGAYFLMDAFILDMRIYFGHAHILWIWAYILDMGIYFGKAPTF
jgi:hypothetical protein